MKPVDGDFPPPRLVPGTDRWPVVLSVPHSGRHYSPALLRLSRRGLESLRPLEDPLVDRLVWRAQALGISTVVAETPRAAIDCNRAEDEIDPASVRVAPGGSSDSWRVRAGLGLIPSRLAFGGELWRRPIGPGELLDRLEGAHRPFHRMVAEEIERLHRRHREVVLLDCHSMPWRSGQANLVLGDRHGQSAATFVTDLARKVATEAGFNVARNDPYAGGHVVSLHGNPAVGVHAIQLELCRRQYLDTAGAAPGPGFDRCARLLEQIARTIGEALQDRAGLPLAAE